jgi:hypothetical protein
MPINTGYYNPSSTYGSPTDYRTAPVVSGPGGFLANNPEAAWGEFIAPFASGTDPFSNWVRSQFSQVYNAGYKPAMARNPSLTFHDQYLGGSLTPEMLRQRYMQQAPQVRGINVGNYGGGRTRWSLQ